MFMEGPGIGLPPCSRVLVPSPLRGWRRPWYVGGMALVAGQASTALHAVDRSRPTSSDLPEAATSGEHLRR
jgi:hypothetical protein